MDPTIAALAAVGLVVVVLALALWLVYFGRETLRPRVEQLQAEAKQFRAKLEAADGAADRASAAFLGRTQASQAVDAALRPGASADADGVLGVLFPAPRDGEADPPRRSTAGPGGGGQRA